MSVHALCRNISLTDIQDDRSLLSKPVIKHRSENVSRRLKAWGISVPFM